MGVEFENKLHGVRGWLLIAILLVLGSMPITYRTEIWIDYDSGAECKAITIWGITVFKGNLPASPFASLRLNNGLTGLTGNPDWHLAESYRISKQNLIDSQGTAVAAYMAMCGWTLQLRSSNEAIKLKYEFLNALKIEGPNGAHGVWRDAYEGKDLDPK
jgi:hypothetical protein